MCEYMSMCICMWTYVCRYDIEIEFIWWVKREASNKHSIIIYVSYLIIYMFIVYVAFKSIFAGDNICFNSEAIDSWYLEKYVNRLNYSTTIQCIILISKYFTGQYFNMVNCYDIVHANWYRYMGNNFSTFSRIFFSFV